MKKSLLVLFLPLLLGIVCAESMSEDKLLKVWRGNNSMSIPWLDASSAPSIDGRIEKEEWSRSQKSAGFVHADGSLVPGKRSFIYLCRDEQFLYIAVRTSAMNNDPGGGLVTAAKDRDGRVYNDDSVELLMVSDQDENIVYQVILNSGGVVFDQKQTINPKGSDVKWDIQGMLIGSRAESGWWDLEVAIPMAEIGNPSKLLKMNVARNWSGLGTSAMNATKSYSDQSNMLRIHWSKGDWPTLQQNEIGNFEEGTWTIRMTADNPTERTCVMAGMIRHYLFPMVDGKVEKQMIVDAVKEVLVPPKSSVELELDFDTNDNRQRWFSSVLYDQESGRQFYGRLIHGKKGASMGRHPATAEFDLQGIGSGVCWYYPGYNRVATRLSFNSNFNPAQVEVLVQGAKNQQVERQGRYYRTLLPVPSTPGKYKLAVKVTGQDGKKFDFPAVCELEKRTFAWEGNQYGKDKIILPPFTPLRADGPKVSTLMNVHTVNPFGLWNSLLAKGEEILAAPMNLLIIENGKELRWKKGKVGKAIEEDAGYLLRYNSELHSQSGLVVKSEQTCEYDGFTWSKLTFDKVAGRDISLMRLEIPLKNSAVPFFHVISNTIRSNPNGLLPAGEGELWNGSELTRSFPFGEESMHSQLVPYIWLGGVERGLCWFLDSSYGYKLDRKKDAMRIIRRGDVVLLEVDLINRPAQLKDGFSLEFGMQATPVKPIDPQLRGLTRDPRGAGVDGLGNIMTVSGHLTGFPYNWSKTPYNEDYSLFREIVAAVRDGAHPDSKAMMKPWFDKYGAAMYEDLKRAPNPGNHPDHLQKVRENFRVLTIDPPTRKASFPIKYSDPRLAYVMDEVTEYFKSEWWNVSPQGYFGALRTYPVPSNMDYLMYGYYHELKNGMHGIYLDDVFLMPEPNPDTVARVDDEGETHPEIGILALRELVKRIAVMQHQFKRFPRILEVHMTNALLVPCFSLATSQLGWEENFGETPLPERYSLDAIQTISLGTKIGAESLALGGILRKTTPWKEWQEKFTRLSRSHLALTLLHNVKVKDRLNSDIDRKLLFSIYQLMSDFGCWKNDSSFVPYWEKEPALISNRTDTRVSSFRRPGKVLVILSNLKGDEGSKLQIDWSLLELPQNTSVINIETGQAVDPENLEIPEYDFMLLQIGGVK